jgi:hypothetical protein
MNNNPTNVTTGRVRLSYVHLFKPYARPGQEPKYSTTILIPKSDVATKQRIDAAIQAAIEAGVNSKWNGVRPPQIAIPIHDGDGPRPSDGMPFGQECKSHWVMTASSNRQQAVVDLSLNPIIDETQVYSGMYARVNVNFFAYNSNGKKGVGCGLGPVQKIEDGEPLGGGISPEQAFSVPYEASQPVPQQPSAYPQAPQQPMYQQPVYPQQPAAYPPAPVYPQQPAPAQPVQQPQQQQQPAQQPVQYDPITGAPITGGVMGI